MSPMLYLGAPSEMAAEMAARARSIIAVGWLCWLSVVCRRCGYSVSRLWIFCFGSFINRRPSWSAISPGK